MMSSCNYPRGPRLMSHRPLGHAPTCFERSSWTGNICWIWWL